MVCDHKRDGEWEDLEDKPLRSGVLLASTWVFPNQSIFNRDISYLHVGLSGEKNKTAFKKEMRGVCCCCLKG